MIRYAVIGTNFITNRFIEAAGQCEDLELVAVYSRSMERAKEYATQHGATLTFDSIPELSRSKQVDMVYIASPNYMHFSQTMDMLKGKKHVLCEKPIASNSRELTLMLQAAKENEVILLEGMRVVFDPGYLEIGKHLHKLGTIRRATFQYSKYSSRYDNFKNGIIENAFNPKLSNGALMDIGVYCVHALVKLFGLPKELHASAIKLENEVDGAGTIVAHYDTMVGELQYSKISNSHIPSEIQGEVGTMVIDKITDPKELIIYYVDGREERIFPFSKKKNMMYYEIQEMVRLIQLGKEASEHNQYSIMELQIIDEARKQMSIVFPADTQIE